MHHHVAVIYSQFLHLQHIQQQLKHINTGTETPCNNNSEYVFGNENDMVSTQPTIVFNKNDNHDDNGFDCDTDNEISFGMFSFIF